MKKQVLAYIKRANEIEQGDRIMTSRMTVAEVQSTEAFADTSGRPCVEVGIAHGDQRAAVVFLSGETVLVLE